MSAIKAVQMCGNLLLLLSPHTLPRFPIETANGFKTDRLNVLTA